MDFQLWVSRRALQTLIEAAGELEVHSDHALILRGADRAKSSLIVLARVLVFVDHRQCSF
jgi:hypothetical protein